MVLLTYLIIPIQAGIPWKRFVSLCYLLIVAMMNLRIRKRYCVVRLVGSLVGAQILNYDNLKERNE